MRHTRLILAFVLLVVVAAVAGWFALGGGQRAQINAANESLLSWNSPDGDPLHASNPVAPANIAPDANAEPAPTPHDTPPADDDNAFVLTGRIEPASDFPAPMRKWLQDDCEVLIVYLADGGEPDTACMIYVGLDEQLGFAATEPPEAFGLGEGEELAPGRWQVLCRRDGEFDDSLADAPEGDLKGLISPRIQGRHIDFGVIPLSGDAFLGDSLVFKGRLLHTSGKALAYSNGMGLYGDNENQPGNGEIVYLEAEAYTSGDGRFFAPAYVDGTAPTDLSGFQFRLHDLGTEGDFEEGYLLPPPVREGRVLDFGDITLKGALVEVVVKGPFNSEGVEPFETLDDYDGDSVGLEFDNGNDYAYAMTLPQPYTSTLLLPEGRFIWDAWASTDDWYPAKRGTLLTRVGDVHRLELEFEPYPSIPVEIIPNEGTPEDAIVHWEIRRGEEPVDNGSLYHRQGHERVGTVPVLQDTITTVEVHAADYDIAKAEAGPDTKKLVIPLIRNASPRGTLIVTVPAFPGAMDPAFGSSVLRLSGTGTNRAAYVQVTEWQRESQEITFDVREFGSFVLGLTGGEAYGFPNGVIYATPEFELAAGETRRIEIPPLPTPPWPRGIKNTRITALAGGRPMNLECWLAYEASDTPQPIDVSHDGDFRARGRPVAIKDDFSSHPVEFTLPATGDEAQLRIDFPHTIEVRVTRNSEPVSDFTATATSEDAELAITCSARAVDGAAQLWFPQGKARVIVWTFGDIVYSQLHSVSPGGMVRIEAKLDLARLTVEFAGGPRDVVYTNSELPELWRLDRQTKDGAWKEHDAVSYPDELYLEPALYRLVPWNGGAGHAVEADLRDGDRTVTLPELPAREIGALVLKFDVSRLGDHWASAEFMYQTTHRLTSGNRDEPEGLWTETKVVPDGFRIEGLPMHTELAIWGGIWIEDEDRERALVLTPLRVTIEEDGKMVDADLRPGVQLHDEWYDISARLITGIEGLSVKVDYYVSSGRNEYAFYDHNGKFLLKEWATLPETAPEGGAKIPAHIRARLEAMEALPPRDDEDDDE